jgi:hypothetical protein
VRFWTVGPALIAYRVMREDIQVLFIERGETDWESVLGKPLE